MRRRNQYIIYLFLLFQFLYSSIFSQHSRLSFLLKEAKEATFSGDSAKLFSLGEKIIHETKLKKDNFNEPEVYLYYGNFFFYKNNIEKSIQYFKKASGLASENGNKYIETLSKARLEYITPDNDSAEVKLNLLFEEAEKNKDYLNVSEILVLLGNLKKEKNDLKTEAELCYKGLSYAEEHNQIYYQAVFKNNLGLIKYSVGNFDDALNDFIKALELAKKQDNKNLLDNVRINLAITYTQKKLPKKAIELMNDVLYESKKNKHYQKIAVLYINISSLFVDNDINTSLQYLDSAIVTAETYGYQRELIKGLLGKAQTLINLTRYQEARENMSSAKLLLDKSGILEDMLQYWQQMETLDTKTENYKRAYQDYKNYIVIKDSITKMTGDEVLNNLKYDYNLKKKEVELEKEKTKTLILENNNQIEKFTKWITIGVVFIIFVIVLSGIIVWYSKKIREKKEQFSHMLIEKIEEERSRISKDLHDNIGHSLSIVKSRIVRGKMEETESESSLKDYVNNIISQVRMISHDLFPSYMEKIGLEKAIISLTNQIQAATGIECNCDVTPLANSLSSNIQLHLFRIIQECANNTIKHSEANALKIVLSEKNGTYWFVYEDNGKGINTEQIKGMGILAIKERANSIGAQMSIEQNSKKKGFKLILKFKKL